MSENSDGEKRRTQLEVPHPASSHPTTVKPAPQASDMALLSLRFTQSPSYLKHFCPFQLERPSTRDSGSDIALFSALRVGLDTIVLPVNVA